MASGSKAKTNMSNSEKDNSPATVMAELLHVVTPQVERIEEGFKVIRVTLDALADHLRAREIPTMVYYSCPLHRQALYRHQNRVLPEAERACREMRTSSIIPSNE